MPRVARQEDRPEDWAATTAQALAWDRGYIHVGETLICRACGATVPNSFKTSGTYGLAGPRNVMTTGTSGWRAAPARADASVPSDHPSTIAAIPAATTAAPTNRCSGRASPSTSQPSSAPTTMLLSRAAATRDTGVERIASSTRM